MSWFAQVRHVFVKDVRAQRWLLILLAGSLALSAVMSLWVGRPGDLAAAATQAPASITYDAWDAPQSPAAVEVHDEILVVNSGTSSTGFSVEPVGGMFTGVLAPFIAVLLCALIVLADHPTQPRAQWASLPYNRSSVLGAKLGFVLMLVVYFAIAQAIPLFALRLPAAEIPARLSEFASSIVMMCVVALLLASAARDLRTVVFLVVVLYVASIISGLLMSVGSAPWIVPTWIATLSQPVMLFASATWLYFMYRTRPRHARVRVASVVVAGLMFAPAKLQMLTPIDAPFAATQSLPGVDISSRLEAKRSPTTDSLTLIWHLRSSGIPSAWRATQQYSSPYANSDAPECAGLYLNLPGQSYGTLQAPQLPLGGSLTWPAGAPRSVDSLSFSRVVWSGRSRTPEARCVSRGWPVRLELSEPVLFAELPLRTGARDTRSGQRAVIRDAEENGSNRVASVVTFSVSGGTLCNFDAPTFVLVNRVQHEAVLLQAARQSSGFSGQLCTQRYVLSLADSLGRETSWPALGKQSRESSASWLRDAQLMVFSQRSRAVVSITPTAAEGTSAATDGTPTAAEGTP